jgi:hypothetical protein
MMYGQSTSLLSFSVFVDHWNTSKPDSAVFTPPRACRDPVAFQPAQ